MKLAIEPGKYVVAVSGGVDSMVLLHLLKQVPGAELVVAHFDHGIREESPDDRAFVEKICATENVSFVYEEGSLGTGASEETARNARYDFLRRIKHMHHADKIITAHHQDDVLETALLNLLRGTGRKGLASLSSTNEILRPLLPYSKKEIQAYAKTHGIQWVEDKTNTDIAYARNYIRLRVMPKLSDIQREELLGIITETRQKNDEIDELIATFLQKGDENVLSRKQLVQATHAVACELMAGWLRAIGLRDFDKPAIERLVIGAKTLKPGVRLDISKHYAMTIGKEMLHITHAPGRNSFIPSV